MSPLAAQVQQRLAHVFPGVTVRLVDPHGDGTCLELYFGPGAPGGGTLAERQARVLAALEPELATGRVETVTLHLAPEEAPVLLD